MRTTIALAALTFTSAIASAQISLSSAVDLAVKNDRRVKVAEAEVKKADATLAETHDAFIPVVTVDGGYGKSVDVPQGLPTIFSLATQSVAFNISQVQAIKAAQNGLRSAILALKDARALVTEDVTITYVSLASAEKRKSALTDESGFAKRLADVVQDRLDAGQDTRIELLRSQRTLAQITLVNLQTEDDIAALREHLARSIGLDGVPIATVPDSIPPPMALSNDPAKSPVSAGIAAAFANVESKREQAKGESLSRFLPQLILSGSFSKIDTSEKQSNFLDYYPSFKGEKTDSASIGIQARFAIFDRGQFARAREAEAEAARAEFQAEADRNLFLEGRFKLGHVQAELAARTDLAEIDFQLAQEQLKTVLIQLSSTGSDPNTTLMTPKDEQNARLQERQRYVDLLDSQLELRKAQINLMRQTGTLEDWVNQSIRTPTIVATPLR